MGVRKREMMLRTGTHEDNWLELCFYGNSCHAGIHNGTITWELLHDSAEWSMIVGKFLKIYPYIAEGERKNIHPLLLKELTYTNTSKIDK
jgi:hypothetical protein